MRRAARCLPRLGVGPRGARQTVAATCRVREEESLEYPASIKVHAPCRAGVLVELAGEFDVSCLEAFGHALSRASGLGRRIFVDLAGVKFMDTLCLRKLASGFDAGAGSLKLCRPSWQFRLGVAACGMEDSFEILPDDDPGYETLISEVCECERTVRTAGPSQHHLYMLAAL